MRDAVETPASDEPGSGTDSPPLIPGESPPALRYTINQYQKATGTLPVSIDGDSRREMIGFYLARASDPVQIWPALGDATNAVELSLINPMLELRYSSHGPLAREQWNADCAAGNGILTVIIISPDGG